MDSVDCKSKKSNLCSKFPFQITPLMHRDDTSRFITVEGETLHHFLYVSSFFDYTVVDVVNVRKIDPEIPPHKACLFSCGVSTGNFMTLVSIIIIFRVSCIHAQLFINHSKSLSVCLCCLFQFFLYNLCDNKQILCSDRRFLVKMCYVSCFLFVCLKD